MLPLMWYRLIVDLNSVCFSDTYDNFSCDGLIDNYLWERGGANRIPTVYNTKQRKLTQIIGGAKS